MDAIWNCPSLSKKCTANIVLCLCLLVIVYYNKLQLFLPINYFWFFFLLTRSYCNGQTVFATDLHSRGFIQLPKSVGVDFRASYVVSPFFTHVFLLHDILISCIFIDNVCFCISHWKLVRLEQLTIHFMEIDILCNNCLFYLFSLNCCIFMYLCSQLLHVPWNSILNV